MPTYDFDCPNCGNTETDVLRSLAEYETPFPCPQCGMLMKQRLSAPMIAMDYTGYTCPVTGDWVEGRRAHRENLKKHGCRVLEPGEREDVMRQRAAEEKALDAKLEQTVGAAIEAMPPRKQEQLYTELKAGADTAVVRR